jgi:alpha-1,6-mannosyltransferase
LLLALLAAGLVMELCWLVLTPLSYRMTHGAEYTQTLLQTSPLLSGWFDAVTPFAEWLVPSIQQQAANIDPQLNTLVGLFVVSSFAYLLALVVLDRGAAGRPWAMPLVVGGSLLFQLSLLLMPGLLTTDPFSYVMYGRISFLYRLNPYVVPPGAFPDDPVLGWVHPAWVMAPSVYGPLWTDLGWLMTRLGSSLTLVQQVFSYKLLMNAVQLTNLALVWRLLGGLGPRDGRVVGFAMYAWNPLVLFEVAGNAHNDALMLTFLLLSLLPLTGRPRWLPALLLAWLGTLVKFTAGLPLLFYGVAGLRRYGARWLCSALLPLVLVGLLVSWRWLGGDALAPLLATAGGSFYGNSLPDLLGTMLSEPTGSLDSGRVAAKVVTRAAFVLYLLWQVVRVWREPTLVGILRASVKTMLALLILVLTWVLTWYFLWPLTLALFLGWRSTLARVAVAFSLTCLPMIYLKHYWADAMPDALVLIYVAVPLLFAAAVQATQYPWTNIAARRAWRAANSPSAVASATGWRSHDPAASQTGTTARP